MTFCIPSSRYRCSIPVVLVLGLDFLRRFPFPLLVSPPLVKLGPLSVVLPLLLTVQLAGSGGDDDGLGVLLEEVDGGGSRRLVPAMHHRRVYVGVHNIIVNTLSGNPLFSTESPVCFGGKPLRKSIRYFAMLSTCSTAVAFPIRPRA